MLWLWERSSVDEYFSYCSSVAAESQECLNNFYCPASKGKLRGHKKLGGDRIRIADLNWPKGFSIPYNIMRRDFKNCGESAGVAAIA